MKLYLNLSLCCLKQAKSSRAITYGRKVLDLEPNNAKANYRLGQVRIIIQMLNATLLSSYIRTFLPNVISLYSANIIVHL